MPRGTLVTLIALTFLPSVQAQQPPRHPKYPRWISSYEAARTVAKDSGKPIFLVFRCEP